MVQVWYKLARFVFMMVSGEVFVDRGIVTG